MRAIRSISSDSWMGLGHLLAAKGREGLVVVGAGRSTATATATSKLAAWTVATTATIAIATEATTAASTTLAAVATITTTITAAAATSTTGGLAVLGEEAAWIDVAHVDIDLLLLFTEASSLATATGHVVLLLLVARECLALWELLAGALVWLAHVVREGELLLGLLTEIVVVALGLDLWLGWLSIFAILWWWGVGVEALSFLGLSNGLASLLIREFGFTSFSAPAMSCLLWVVAVMSISYVTSILEPWDVRNATLVLAISLTCTSSSSTTASTSATTTSTVLACRQSVIGPVFA